MLRSKRPLLLLTGLLITVVGLLLMSASTSRAADVRIMPLGDSITGSPGCWRATLWNDLQSAGITEIDFVGTLPSQGCGVPHDGDNEGHGGYLATNIAAQNQLVGWLDATNPDVVLMHLGTNDVWSSRPTQTILDAFTTLVGQMRDNNPNMQILVAQIIPMDSAQSCSSCGQGVVNLNAAIPAWASSLSTAQSPIIVVDHWTGFDTAVDTYDGVHPSASGDQKMAQAWFDTLAPLLDSDVTPAPTNTPGGPTNTPVPPTATATALPPTATRVPGGYCDVELDVVNQWGNGFQADVTITNTSLSPIAGWELVTDFEHGEQVTAAWNATVSQSGTTLTASNVASHWNGTIQPGGTANFGMQGTHTGTVAAPSLFTLNGTACGEPLPPTETPEPTNTPGPTDTPAACPPDPTNSATLSAETTNLAVGDTFGVTFATTLGIPLYTLRVDGDEIMRVDSSNNVTVMNESSAVIMVNNSYPPVLQVLEAGTITLHLSANGETFAYFNPPECQQAFVFVTETDTVDLNVVGATATATSTVMPTSTSTPMPTATSTIVPTSTATAMPTATATPGSGGTCAVDYDIVNQWGDGFQVNLTIENTGISAVEGYTLSWDFISGEQLGSGWNATYSQTGTTASASNPASQWNGTIQPNNSVSFGFVGTHSGTVSVPAAFDLNGMTCQ